MEPIHSVNICVHLKRWLMNITIFNFIFYKEKYQDTPESSKFTKVPLRPKNCTLYKVFIHSNLQALLTKDGRNGPKLALFTKYLSV